jgi:1,4-dihydroxy-2-naphthoyl-CoA synthase
MSGESGFRNVNGRSRLSNVVAETNARLAAIMARLYAPDEAIEAGFLDEVLAADAVKAAAIAKAQAWSTLHADALAYNKAAFRDDAIARVLAAVED